MLKPLSLAGAALLSAYTVGIEVFDLVPDKGPYRVAPLFLTIAAWLAILLYLTPTIAQKIEEALISALLAATTLIVFAEVVMRYGFNFGFPWIEELTLILAGWMVLLGMSYGIKVGSHIGVDAFVRLLKSSARRRVTQVAVLLCLVYCALFILGAWEYIIKLYKIGIELKDLPIPKWVAFSGLMIGFILLTFRFLELLVALVRGSVDGFSLADEAREALRLREAAAAQADAPPTGTAASGEAGR